MAMGWFSKLIFETGVISMLNSNSYVTASNAGTVSLLKTKTLHPTNCNSDFI